MKLVRFLGVNYFWSSVVFVAVLMLLPGFIQGVSDDEKLDNPDNWDSSNIQEVDFSTLTPNKLNQADSNLIKNHVSQAQANDYLSSKYPLDTGSLSGNEWLLVQKLNPNLDESLSEISGLNLNANQISYNGGGNIDFSENKNLRIKSSLEGVLIGEGENQITVSHGNVKINSDNSYDVSHGSAVITSDGSRIFANENLRYYGFDIGGNSGCESCVVIDAEENKVYLNSKADLRLGLELTDLDINLGPDSNGVIADSLGRDMVYLNQGDFMINVDLDISDSVSSIVQEREDGSFFSFAPGSDSSDVFGDELIMYESQYCDIDSISSGSPTGQAIVSITGMASKTCGGFKSLSYSAQDKVGKLNSVVKSGNTHYDLKAKAIVEGEEVWVDVQGAQKLFSNSDEVNKLPSHYDYYLDMDEYVLYAQDSNGDVRRVGSAVYGLGELSISNIEIDGFESGVDYSADLYSEVDAFVDGSQEQEVQRDNKKSVSDILREKFLPTVIYENQEGLKANAKRIREIMDRLRTEGKTVDVDDRLRVTITDSGGNVQEGKIKPINGVIILSNGELL